MNRLVQILIPALLLLAAAGQAQNLLVNPESIAYDAVNNRYLVSNYGDGQIIAIAPDRTQSIWYSGLVHSYGCEIAGSRFYVSIQDKRVVGINLETAMIEWEIQLYSPRSIDGVTWDGGNFLYIVDTNGRILKADIAAQSYVELIPLGAGLVAGIQDVVYDGTNNRLLVASYALANPVLAIDLTTLVITPAMSNPPVRLDGICMSADGFVYLSSHVNTGRSERWSGVFSSPAMPVATGLDQPAGCCYNNLIGELAVVSFTEHTVTFVQLSDLDGDGIPALWDNCPANNNPDQTDADNDGIGDPCDLCTDTDNDGFGEPGFAANTCAPDNCPGVSNPDQNDLDQDQVGDECDNCFLVYNPDQEDRDLDGKGDVCDGCCRGRVGDVNADGADEPTISDISTLIDMLFLSTNPVPCLAEADVNQSGGFDPGRDDVTISDVSVLIDYLFLTGSTLGLPGCL